MVAVDHVQRPTGGAKRRKLLHCREDAATVEQHLADQDEVMLARAGRGQEALRKTVEGLGREMLDRNSPCLEPAGKLPAGAMELAVAGEHAQWAGLATRRGGHEPDKEIVSVRRKDDSVRHAAADLP